jgi:hypothetical protein
VKIDPPMWVVIRHRAHVYRKHQAVDRGVGAPAGGELSFGLRLRLQLCDPEDGFRSEVNFGRLLDRIFNPSPAQGVPWLSQNGRLLPDSSKASFTKAALVPLIGKFENDKCQRDAYEDL